MASRSIVRHQLFNVIRRFKFEELEDAVIPIFPEISWARTRSILIKNHKPFNSYNVGLIIQETIDSANLSEKQIYDRLTTLEVIDVSRHSSRRIWYGYQLTESNKAKNYLRKRDIEDNITEELHSVGLTLDVKVATHEDITFIYIKEKPKKTKRKRGQSTISIFFAFFLGHKYIFCSKKVILFDVIKVVITCLGYKRSKRIKLMGKNLKSLIRLLWIKQQGVLHTENINQQPAYEPSDPIVKNDGTDYTQDNQRNKYAKQCFGEDPPTLESLVVTGPEGPILHNDLASMLPDDTMNINWEFHSKNIPRFLTTLITKRVITMPLPEYISKFMKLGKNELTMRIE